MRLYFKAAIAEGRAPLSGRSSACSRTPDVPAADLFVTDDKGIREEYAVYLTPAQREFVDRWKHQREIQKTRNAVWQRAASKDTKTARAARNAGRAREQPSR
jgi:hypothetical protein